MFLILGGTDNVSMLVQGKDFIPYSGRVQSQQQRSAVPLLASWPHHTVGNTNRTRKFPLISVKCKIKAQTIKKVAFVSVSLVYEGKQQPNSDTVRVFVLFSPGNQCSVYFYLFTLVAGPPPTPPPEPRLGRQTPAIRITVNHPKISLVISCHWP